MGWANKLPHQIPEKHDNTSKQYVWWNVYDPRCNGGARASDRANSSAAGAIDIDVASSSTVPAINTNNNQELEATADRATYTAGRSCSSCCGIAAAIHH